jgi:glycerol uptake facilitator-like aquaporin
MRPRIAAEFVGSGILLYVIVSSGVAVEGLSEDRAVQLFTHAIVVGLALAVAVLMLAPVSGAHLNPAVTFVSWRRQDLSGADALWYVLAQISGALTGVALAHASFEVSMLSVSTTDRGGLGKALAEAITTFVLVLAVLGLTRARRPQAIPWAVGGWVATAVFATSSTGFGNPTVTLARAFTDTFAGIDPVNVPVFIAAQLLGALVALGASTGLFPVQSVEPTREETMA